MKDEDVQKFIIGLTIVVLLNKFLKNLLKIPRPLKNNTYGMPSTRSAVLTYIIIFIVLLFISCAVPPLAMGL